MTLAKTKIANGLKKFQNNMKNMNLLKNKYVLYLVLLISLADLFLFARAGEIFHIIVFIIVGLLMSRFTMNMVVILLVALIITNIVKYGMKIRHEREGLENPTVTLDMENVYKQFSDEEKDYLKGVVEGVNPDIEGLVGNDEKIYNSLLDYIKEKEGSSEEEEEADDEEEADEEEGKPEGMRNKKSEKKEKKNKKEKKRRTIEGLEEEAQKLIKTQENLKNNMEALEPMLKQAEKFMNQFEKEKEKK